MTVTDSHDAGALEAALAASEARAAAAEAKASDAEAQVAALTLMIEKLRRALYGRRSERKERLLDQLELALDELTASASEDELAAEKAAAGSTEVKAFVRRKPSRKPFPDHLPRERVVVPGPVSCACCGSERLSKIGEDVTETLEVIPRQRKVVQTVREKFTCRSCEKISQPPAPFHTVPRGWAGPNLLAMILFEKYGQHQPLNRQRDTERACPALAPRRCGQGDGLHAQALGRLRPLPRRRPHLHHEQRRRAGAAPPMPRETLLALRRVRPRRRAGRSHVHPHRHRQVERRRPSGVARRRPRPDRRPAADPAVRTPALELEGRTAAGLGGVSPTLHRPVHG